MKSMLTKILVAIALVASTSALAGGPHGGRGYYNGGHGGSHHHGGSYRYYGGNGYYGGYPAPYYGGYPAPYYGGSYAPYWGAAALGVVTGAIIANANRPQTPVYVEREVIRQEPQVIYIDRATGERFYPSK